VQPNYQRAIDMSMSDTLFNIVGAVSPDTSRALKWFYSSISLDSQTVDSIEYIRRANFVSDPTVLRRDDNINYLFMQYFRGNEDGSIMLIRNRKPDSIVEESTKLEKSFSLFSVFPNPFNSSLTVSIPYPSFINRELKIYDLNGRLLVSQALSSQISGIYPIPALGQIPSGKYFLTLSSNDANETSAIAPVIQITKTK